MEHFSCAYSQDELKAPPVVSNLDFIRKVEEDLSAHPLYGHRLMRALSQNEYGDEALRFVLASFYKVIEPWTGILALLAGRAPDLKSRHVIFDNLYEEMGMGDYERAHPTLWQGMLASIGVSLSDVASARPLDSIAELNQALREAVLQPSFALACACISLSELTIPDNFGYIIRGIERTFPAETVDRRFFDRHGVRDEGHAEDTDLLFALYASPADVSALERQGHAILDLRGKIWDELETRCAQLKPL